jgi:hypothetical protein
MGNKMMQANTHATPLVERMDWHQKTAFADAGSLVVDYSTMKLLHWLLAHLHAMMVCDLSSTDQKGTHLDRKILEMVSDWDCTANLEVYIRGLEKMEVKELGYKESY